MHNLILYSTPKNSWQRYKAENSITLRTNQTILPSDPKNPKTKPHESRNQAINLLKTKINQRLANKTSTVSTMLITTT